MYNKLTAVIRGMVISFSYFRIVVFSYFRIVAFSYCRIFVLSHFRIFFYYHLGSGWADEIAKRNPA